MNYLKIFFILLSLSLTLSACKSAYVFKEEDIVKLNAAILNSSRLEFNLPPYPNCITPTNSTFWGELNIDKSAKQNWQRVFHRYKRGIKGGHLVDFDTNSIFIFYYKEVGNKYVLVEEESYFYKNKFQKYFGETSPENVYIRMLFSYDKMKFISIDLYENSQDINGELVSKHRKLTPEQMRDILSEWKMERVQAKD